MVEMLSSVDRYYTIIALLKDNRELLNFNPLFFALSELTSNLSLLFTIIKFIMAPLGMVLRSSVIIKVFLLFSFWDIVEACFEKFIFLPM